MWALWKSGVKFREIELSGGGARRKVLPEVTVSSETSHSTVEFPTALLGPEEVFAANNGTPQKWTLQTALGTPQ